MVRLALCQSAHDGEWQNAAVAIFRQLRAMRMTPDLFTWRQQPHQPHRPQRDWPVMPFGKHRGVSIDRVPRDYLEWVLDNCTHISAHLRRSIEEIVG